MAAVLACGPSAVVSHRSAATLWAVLGDSVRLPAVDVIVRGCDRRRSGVRIRRIATVEEDEVTRLDGIPVTAPARTLYDLAAVVRPRTLERAVAEACSRRLTDADQIAELVVRHPKGPGLRALRTLLARGSPVLTRSDAEERFLTLLRKARLDPPEVNVDVAGFEVDFLWRREGLVTEIDGFAFHSSPHAFERDRRRDAVLAAEGFNVVRVTWRQLVKEPEAVVVRLARALTRARPGVHLRSGGR
jgi:very-short-patch-repair endonuclease